MTFISTGLQWNCHQCGLDSIAVSIFVVILVDFDKYRICDEQAFVAPLLTNQQTLAAQPPCFKAIYYFMVIFPVWVHSQNEWWGFIA